MKKTAALTLICLSLWGGTAIGAEDPLMRQLLTEVDADADGVLTPSEIDAWLAKTRESKRTEAKDAWGKLMGFLGKPSDATEFAGTDYVRTIGAALTAADTDKDGTVSKPERQAYLSGIADEVRRGIATDVMDKFDADEDGAISAKERTDGEAMLAATPKVTFKEISDAAAAQPNTEAAMFKMMAKMKGDAEGRIKVSDVLRRD